MKAMQFALAVALSAGIVAAAAAQELGAERALDHHLEDGEEYLLPVSDLLDHGRRLFAARWTTQDGAGRPLSKGTGAPLADPLTPLVFPRNFNRISGPDANACVGCHNLPRIGGAGDQVANVFVLGQRFDFATFDFLDATSTRGSADERALPVTLATIGNERNTTGLFGSGYIEMLARQLTSELQSIRDRIGPGESASLDAGGIHFGVLAREASGRWDTTGVPYLTPMSLAEGGPGAPPSLIVRPFHQASAVISLREFTNNAFNHHHGMQSTERFGDDTDPDGDGYVAELTRADITAATVFQATLAVPGRAIPRNRRIEQAVLAGEQLFLASGCADCHVPSLDLTEQNGYFSEPGPYNPPGNLSAGDAPELAVDLADRRLPLPRLARNGSTTTVPAYTDFRLHDITDGPDDPDCEPLNMHAGTALESGNCRFLTAKLWGVASSDPYFHHGRYTTLRQAIAAHSGEAAYSRDYWLEMTDDERNAVIEFLKTLVVLPAGTRFRIVDERYRPRQWRGALQ